MDIEYLRKFIDAKDNMSVTLGIEYVSVPGEDICSALLHVDKRTRQPFGLLSGGASLAVAENLAGVGSLSICVPQIALENSKETSEYKLPDTLKNHQQTIPEEENYQRFLKYFIGIPVGSNVCANHIRPARDGEKLVAQAKLAHKGHSQHIWKVEIKNARDQVISMITVTNHIITSSELSDDIKKEVFLKLI